MESDGEHLAGRRTQAVCVVEELMPKAHDPCDNLYDCKKDTSSSKGHHHYYEHSSNKSNSPTITEHFVHTGSSTSSLTEFVRGSTRELRETTAGGRSVRLEMPSRRWQFLRGVWTFFCYALLYYGLFEATAWILAAYYKMEQEKVREIGKVVRGEL